jgi:hypothetical protein
MVLIHLGFRGSKRSEDLKLERKSNIVRWDLESEG